MNEMRMASEDVSRKQCQDQIQKFLKRGGGG